MDIWNKQKRSEVMSKIHSENTKPEMVLRKALFTRGYRYRVNYKKLPGKPDIAFPKHKIAIFIHGCFWHGHEKGCIDSHIPKTNTEYWAEKIRRNKERDENNIALILSMGWKVLTIWDCEIQQKDNIKLIIQKIIDIIDPPIPHKQNSLSIKFYEAIDDNIVMVAEDTIAYGENHI